VEFHCLQKEIRAEDRAWLERIGVVRTHAAMLRDFGDTAALIEAMDLVISIDTAVAHLAGALAKPVWIMLPFNPDWRWLLGRDDSPWYPTARLFRQPVRGDWDAVLRSVAASLQL
jgi:ADP-heptose:LPS heptosyltransferase